MYELTPPHDWVRAVTMGLNGPGGREKVSLGRRTRREEG